MNEMERIIGEGELISEAQDEICEIFLRLTEDKRSKTPILWTAYCLAGLLDEMFPEAEEEFSKLVMRLAMGDREIFEQWKAHQVEH